MKKKIAFFELELWEKDWLTRELGGAELLFYDGKLDKDHMPQDAGAEALSIFVGSAVTKAVIDGFPKLTFIATRSTGYDHIDLAACRGRGITVSNVPTYSARTVAEYTFALILTLSRKVYEAVDRIRETGSFSLEGLRGADLNGKTLGVIGTGNIGSNVIRIAKGFNMKVLAYDPRKNEQLAAELGFAYMPLEALLASSDVITLHVPYIPATHYLLNKENLKTVKRGALLINTARGGLVETDALVGALHTGVIGGAALDVLEEEGAVKEERELALYGHPEEHNLKTILQNHVLMNVPNVIVTPHNAFNTREALEEILRVSVENIRAWLRGFPQNLVG